MATSYGERAKLAFTTVLTMADLHSNSANGGGSCNSDEVYSWKKSEIEQHTM